MSASAPDMPVMPDQPSSNLGAVMGNSSPQLPSPQSAGSPEEQDMNNATSGPQPSQGGGSRLQSVLAAVAKVGATALQGVPAGGRPSFAGGLGQGARAEQAAQNLEQNIRFKSFDDQIRAAQLHNQDLEMQGRVQAQQDAHEDHMDAQEKQAAANDWGVTYDKVANNSDAVMQHLQTQTAANGSASVPPGTHVSGDGKTINIPQDTPSNDAAMLKEYNALGPVFNLPKAPAGAQKLSPAAATVYYNLKQGYGPDGSVFGADKLPGIIASNQNKLDDLNKNGGSDAQKALVQGIIAKQQAQLKADNDQAATAAGGKKGAETAAEVAANTSPSAIAGQAKLAGAKANAEVPAKIAEQNNAAANAAKNKEGDASELNAVAFDPDYKNPDGSTGANVVMSKADAAAKGLTHYKADPGQVNSLVAGFNDVQNKLNGLAAIVNDPKRYGAVVPGDAAALLTQKGIDLGASVGGGHFGIDTSRFNATQYAKVAAGTNQATRDYVTAMAGAHEAITQLPRLQTFGKSSRMTQQQMEAAQQLLPGPGDGPMGHAKMASLQQMLDPLRKQVPHMPGAEQIPSWLEQQQ